MCRNLSRKLKGINLVVDGKIILEYMLMKWNMKLLI